MLDTIHSTQAQAASRPRQASSNAPTMPVAAPNSSAGVILPSSDAMAWCNSSMGMRGLWNHDPVPVVLGSSTGLDLHQHGFLELHPSQSCFLDPHLAHRALPVQLVNAQDHFRGHRCNEVLGKMGWRLRDADQSRSKFASLLGDGVDYVVRVIVKEDVRLIEKNHIADRLLLAALHSLGKQFLQSEQHEQLALFLAQRTN